MSSRNYLPALLFLAVSCSDEATNPVLPPPVAALAHPEVARLGQPVTFSAAASAVATVKDRPDLSAHLVRYRFQVADGSEVAESGSPQWQHTFSVPGSYAVSLTIADDRGQVSTAQSRLQVVADLADMCTGTTDAGCASGLCSAGACTVVACAGALACPAVWFGDAASCTDGFCAPGGP